jgi:hypothetical protein
MAVSTKLPHRVDLETTTQNGIEILALNNPSIEHAPGIISLYTLLDERSGTVATAYLLNARPNVREFASDEEYAAMRNRFIGLISDCMSRRAN